MMTTALNISTENSVLSNNPLCYFSRILIHLKVEIPITK